MDAVTVNCATYEKVDVAVTGNERYLLVTVLDDAAGTVTHYSFGLKGNFEVESYSI